ncbi:MAG: archease [Deltaproteobacteria bacterium]|nr:archease [Deltaproteobacteria bacterium]
MTPFWPIDHTADLGLRVRAQSLDQLFVEAAKGLSLLLAEEFPVTPAGWRQVEIEAPEAEILLADFLSEILSLAVVEGLVTVKVDLESLDQTRIKANLGFMPVADLGGLKQEIKAVTYHGLAIEQIDQGLEATIIFDI